MSSYYGPTPPGWLPTGTGNQSGRSYWPPFTGSPVRLYKNAVYYPNYRVYRNQPPSILNVGAISHIFYAFALLSPDGTVYLSDPADNRMTVDGVQGAIRACTQLKKLNAELKVILSVGGGGQSQHFAAVAASPTTRKTFGASCRQLVDKYDLDGIDIDWEHPSNPTEGQNFTTLLAELRRHLPAPLYALTAALPAAQWALQHIPHLAHAASYLDTLNLMAYDFAGPWTPHSGHHAPLYGPSSASAGVQYCLGQGVRAAKLLLGVPAYGRCFVGCTAPGQAHDPARSSAAGDEGVFEFRDLPRPGATEVVDANAGAAYCVGHDAQGGFVSYDNTVTVDLKAKYVRRERLGGLFYWNGPGDKSEDAGLVYAGYMGLHGP